MKVVPLRVKYSIVKTPSTTREWVSIAMIYGAYLKELPCMANLVSVAILDLIIFLHLRGIGGLN